MGELKSTRLAEQQVVAQVLGEVFVELDAFVEERDALRGHVVGPDDGRGPRAGPAPQIPLVQDGDVCDAPLPEVVGDGKAVHPGPGYDNVVPGLEGRVPPHPLLFE